MKRTLGKKHFRQKSGKEDLRDYRIVQAAFAVYRDDGYCVRCYQKGKLKQYDHVHHVFGRGTEIGDVKEQYVSLLCLCATCHNMYRPVKSPEKERNQEQIKLLKWANQTPVNARFIRPESMRVNE